MCRKKQNTYPAFKTQRSWNSRFGSKLVHIEQQHPLSLWISSPSTLYRIVTCIISITPETQGTGNVASPPFMTLWGSRGSSWKYWNGISCPPCFVHVFVCSGWLLCGKQNVWHISMTTALVFESLVTWSGVCGISLGLEMLSLKMLVLGFSKVRQTGSQSSFCFNTVVQLFSGKWMPL